MSDTIFTIIEYGTLALVVLYANYVERRTGRRVFLYVMLICLIVLYLYLEAFVPANIVDLSQGTLLGVRIATLLTTVLAIALLFRAVRIAFSRFFPKRSIDFDSGQPVGFDANSMVHMTASIYCIYLITHTIVSFLRVGGLTGLGPNFTTVTTTQLWTDLGTWLLFATLGVGWLSRRSLSETVKRLGLRAPTLSELALAGSMAFALYGVAFASDVIWQSFVPQDVYQQQNVVSQAINQSINTLTIAFLLAMTAAIGEEIAFRGALQPVFGLWPTAILFAAVHLQYVLTPASLLILVVGLGLGWLRRRYNTTTAIVAHFLYDFVPTALGILSQVMAVALRVSR